MKKLLQIILLISCQTAFAQLQPLTTPNNGGNKRASVSEQIGFCDVKIVYNRPGVKGREGKIWGTNLAYYGLQDQGFGESRAAPWRVGANESTVISFSTDALVEGKQIAAGSYGLFMNVGAEETTVIFNKNTTAWGSFSYNAADDILQVKVKNAALQQSVEWMKFEFEDQTNNSAVIALMWEKRKIPFKIETDLMKAQFDTFKRELQTPKGFSSAAFIQAASFSLQNNYELKQGSVWADRALGNAFPGERSFASLSTKANFLLKENNAAAADALMKEAVGIGTASQVYNYARALYGQKRINEAIEVYKANYKRFPDIFITNAGMARAFAEQKDYKNALRYAEAAALQAPNEQQKGIAAKMVADLKEGKNVN